MKNNAQQICQSIYKNPSDWCADEPVFFHEKSGIRIFVDPYFFMCGPTPYSVSFNLSFFGKISVMRAFRWWQRWKIDSLLNTELEEKS